jgi:hypothetical protein
MFRLTLEDINAICQPHNDKLIAEGRADKLARDNEKLREALRLARLFMNHSVGAPTYNGPDPYPIIDQALKA